MHKSGKLSQKQHTIIENISPYNSKNDKIKPSKKSKNVAKIFSKSRLSRRNTAECLVRSTIDVFQKLEIDTNLYVYSNSYTCNIESHSASGSVEQESGKASRCSEILCYNENFSIDSQNIPLASTESLPNKADDELYNIPKILEKPPSPEIECQDDSTLISNNSNYLGLPHNERNRKPSDNDSAVDLKFLDDSSDIDRTNNSETDSSRCPSSSLVGIEEMPENSRSKEVLDCSQSKEISESGSSKEILVNSQPKSNPVKRTDSSHSWRKLKAALVWTPFIQKCARRQYPWIQIAGHEGNFKPGEYGTILKKYTGRESICLQMMGDDVLKDFIPQFKSDVDYEGEKYICMQDLLSNFDHPSLMDIKMGVRTYLEEELFKAKLCPKPRQDMYEKMIEIDENEPTAEEHKVKAILKPRYMQWRETLSSTVNLGFRIEGVKKTSLQAHKVVGTQSRDFKKTKSRDDVKEVLVDFIDNKKVVLEKFLQRINELKQAFKESYFFWEHEFIGSSLLFVHDRTNNANVWMIDFGKTVPLPPNCRTDHISPWVEGNHEDGYLFGLDNLLSVLCEIHSNLSDNFN